MYSARYEKDRHSACSDVQERPGRQDKDCGKEERSREEKDLLDLLGRVPGKVSDLQDEIDKMKRNRKQ